MRVLNHKEQCKWNNTIQQDEQVRLLEREIEDLEKEKTTFAKVAGMFVLVVCKHFTDSEIVENMEFQTKIKSLEDRMTQVGTVSKENKFFIYLFASGIV